MNRLEEATDRMQDMMLDYMTAVPQPSKGFLGGKFSPWEWRAFATVIGIVVLVVVLAILLTP